MLFRSKGRKGGDFYSLFSALSLFALGLGKMAFEYRALAILGVLASGERHRFAYWIALVMLIGLRIGPLGNVDETFYAGFYFLSAITLFSAALLQKKKNENYG